MSFAQQWSELVANLQALQPQMMEYALTAGTTRHPNTTGAWSHAIAQLTQAWYVACHLLEPVSYTHLTLPTNREV